MQDKEFNIEDITELDDDQPKVSLNDNNSSHHEEAVETLPKTKTKKNINEYVNKKIFKTISFIFLIAIILIFGFLYISLNKQNNIISTQNNKIEETSKKLKKLEGNISDLEDKICDLESEISDLDSRISDLEWYR